MRKLFPELSYKEAKELLEEVKDTEQLTRELHGLELETDPVKVLLEDKDM